MRRSNRKVTALAIGVAASLAFAPVAPTTAWARTETASLGGAVCCFDLGLRVTVSVDDGHLLSAFEFAGHELLCLRLGPADAVRWGVPIVSIVTELQNARTDRLVLSRGNLSAR